MSAAGDLEHRITELEIQTALQEDLISSLNDTVAKMQQTLDLQQAQLRLLYQRMQDKGANGEREPYSLCDEVPPHY
ncbi:SlyX family protein [Neisseria oralis]|uniref:Protein SlyX homolog n=1 Tax=Neisseria oralis TaxID=1107316 RepID=A0ABW8Q1T4_9NEIS